MANVNLIAGPQPVCWTKNPMIFLFSVAANLPTNAQLEIRITVNGETISQFYPLPSLTSVTTMEVDISSVVDAFAAHTLPDASNNNLQQWSATNISVWCYTTGTGITESIYAFDYICYKAGVGDLVEFNERIVNRQENLVETSYYRQTATPSGLLSWMPQVRPAWTNPAWIAWYVNNPIDGTAEAHVRYKAFFKFGNPVTVIKSAPTGIMLDGTIWHVPIGLKQFGLTDAQVALLQRVEVDFMTDTMDTMPMKSIVLIPDPRPATGAKMVYWQNNFGAIEQWRFRGKTKATSTVERKEMEMLKGSAFGAVNQVYSTNLKPKWTLHTGWVGRDVSVAFNSLLESHNAAFLLDNQFVPLNISSTEMEWQNNDAQTLRGASVEFVLAKPAKFFPSRLFEDFDQ